VGANRPTRGHECPDSRGRRGGEVLRIPAFARFWTADTVGAFGATITTVAIQVLVVTVLDASATELGMINAVQFVPYLLVGLIAGALVDRWPRKPTLVWTNLGRGVLLLLIPVLWLTDALSLGAVASVLFAFGVLSVFGMAAAQSFLPSLVPRSAGSRSLSSWSRQP
jgi:MFS family permease